MPDTPIPEAPKVTNQEALHMHNEGTKTAGIGPARLAEIQQLRESSRDPRDFLRNLVENGGTVSFPSDKVNELKKSFGGGNVDATGAFTGTPESVEERLYKEAGGVIKELADFQRYTEILTEARRTGQTPNTVANGQLEGYANYDALREAALKAVATKITEEMEPVFAGLTKASEIQQIIEERLATDPAFRRLITEGLSKIKQPSTEIATNSEAVALDQRTKELNSQQAQAVSELKIFILASGVDTTNLKAINSKGKQVAGTIALDYLIDNYIGRDLPPAQILNELRHAIIPLFKNAPSAYLPFLAEEKRVQDLEARLAEVDPVRNKSEYERLKSELYGNEEVAGTPGTPGTTIYGAVITPATTGVPAIPKVVGAKELLEKWRTKLTKDTEFAKYLHLNELLSPTITGGTDPSRTMQRLQEIARVKKEIKETDEKKAKSITEGDRATSTSRDERLEQERQAIAELRGIIPRAIAKTLLERAQQADVARQKEHVREFDTESRQMFETVRISMRGGRGLGYVEVGGRLEPRNERSEVLEDARRIALDKDRGLQNVTLIHMGLLGTGRLGDDGNPHPDGGDIQSIDDLNARQRAMFDKVFASESQAIKMKVARDLMLSQSFGGGILDKLPIPGRSQNGLSADEWREFSTFYSKDAEKIVSATKEGRDAVAQLERAGIKPDSSTGRKWLLWLALILGGGATIASLGGLATIIPALAGGGASAIKAVAMGAGNGADAVINGGASPPHKGL